MILIQPKAVTNLLRQRDLQKIKNDVNRIGALQVRAQLPEHFEPSAQTRFRYERRSTKYNIRKERVTKRPAAPLVFTGELRRAVLSSARVTATANRGTVIARGSRTSVLRTQFKDEIERLTFEQKRVIARDWGRNFKGLTKLPEFQRKRRA